MFLHKDKVKPPKGLRTARLSYVKNQISTPIIQTNVTGPKKVIKALYDYQSQSPNELSFKRGDFFLVTARENDSQFYEAFNPITNSRGIVPVPYFQALEKHEKSMVDSAHSNQEAQQLSNQKNQPVYGIVLYDFKAERLDELDAKAGEAILIIAQSNPEWYVAKPIGRLGGPGLIPVTFVDIRDASTGGSLIHQSFPNVEEWKKKSQGAAELGQALGKLNLKDEDEDVIDNHGYFDFNPKSNEKVISAYIDSHILEGDQYWFIVFAKLSNGKFRVLYRLYEDFYDFQISFLQEYPVEAGKHHQPRILPYMPGPLDSVNEDITADRAKELSTYCQELLDLPSYLSECDLVQELLFGIHEGDIETDIDPNGASNQNPSSTPTTPTPAPVQLITKESIKVKIIFKDEIFAIKLPLPSSLDILIDKVVHRLGFNPIQLQLKSGDRYFDLDPIQFEEAIQLGKMTVVAN